MIKNLTYWLSYALMMLFSLSISAPAMGARGVCLVLVFFLATIWMIALNARDAYKFMFISLMVLSIFLFFKCYINEKKDQRERINETYQHLIENEST